MIDSPVISVVMPLYDAREFLAEAIQSVLDQTFSDFELLIIDDSTDGSYEIAKSFSDPRIRIIRNDPPLGLRKSSNIGIREAKGKYIARMEADDICLPGRLEKQLGFMEANPEVTVSGCWIETFGNERGVWKFPLTDAEIKAGLIFGITIAHPTTFARRDFLINNGLFYREDGFPYAEDWEFFYTMRNKAVFKSSDEVLYRYRRSGGSVTKRMKPNRDGIMREMFTRVLSDFGIDFTGEELLLHRFLTRDFIMSPTPENIGMARAWLEKLMRHNRVAGQFPASAFEKACEEKWSDLFYYLPPYGGSAVRSYLRKSPRIQPAHLSYFFKYSVNKLIGRNL